MTGERVIVRFLDGRILKGTTEDFAPGVRDFTLRPLGKHTALQIRVAGLKAIFYVKYFDGRPFYTERKSIYGQRRPDARKVTVHFSDGEHICGWTQIEHPDAAGFFLYPGDRDSNNERIYVVNGPGLEGIRFDD